MLAPEDAYNRAMGRRIRTVRKRKGMNQATLAALLDLGRTSVVMIEKGEQRVHAHLLVRLGTALGVSANELLGLVETSPPSPAGATLPRSAPARRWVIAGLTQTVVVAADDADEEEDAHDDRGEDQDGSPENVGASRRRHPAPSGRTARAGPRTGIGDAPSKRR